MGGAAAAIDYMKAELVGSNAARVRGVETGGLTVVGVNRYTETEASPLSAGEGAIETVDPRLEAEVIGRLKQWKSDRDPKAAKAALGGLESAAKEGRNLMPASLEAAKAGVTTGEWADTLRGVFGEYRGPTGVAVVVSRTEDADEAEVRSEVERVSQALGETLRLLVGKPGLDGHSNGAEQIATRARAVGMEVFYDGIRSTPAEIVQRAKATRAHVVGLSILSGSHLDLVQEVVRLMRLEGLEHVPVIVGGIIPPQDALVLKQMGVRRVYTPKDFKITPMMGDVARTALAAVSEARA
jgi:(2R)-ethylmalonyl-CoA mutase